MAVAFDMIDADQGGDRQVLLDTDPGLGGQILPRHEIARPSLLPVPAGAPRGVDQRLVEALACLAGNAGVSEPLGFGEGIEIAVGLVDDYGPFGSEGADVALQRHRPRDRLFDERDRLHQPSQCRRLPHRPPQLEHAVDVPVLLVAVEADHVRIGQPVEHRGDRRQPRHVGVHVTADLELEIAVTVDGDHLLQGLRQAVVDPFALATVGGDDRIDHADGMAGVNARGGAEPGEERGDVVPLELGQQPLGRDARKVGVDGGEDRRLVQLAQPVEDRPVDQRRPEAGDQRIEAALGAGPDLQGIAGGEQTERGVRSRTTIQTGGVPQGGAKLIEIVLVAQFQVLVEPLRCQHLCRHAPGLAPAVAANPDTDEGLRRLGQGHHAEAERHAQFDVALV